MPDCREENQAASLHVSISGERVILLAARALYWPAAETLIVADFHWGKSETFHASGIPIPDGVLAHDLARLSSLLERTGAGRLLVLGDLIHSHPGLTPRLVESIASWRRRFPVRFDLVPGNHDRHAPDLPPDWRITVLAPTVREGPFTFTHDSGPDPRNHTLAGHIHPMVSLADAGGSLRLPCFFLGKRLTLLPAFSLFTRGKTVRRGPDARLVAIGDGQVFDLGVRRVAALAR